MSFHPTSRRLHARTGFTLVELLTVIAIVGVLVAITIPIVGMARSSAKNTKCKNNLRQLHAAYLLYTHDNKGKVPTDDTTGTDAVWTLKVDRYMRVVNLDKNQKMYEMYFCPALEEDSTRLWWNSDYAANIHGAIYASWSHAGRKAPTMLNGIMNPARVFVFADWLPGWRFAQVSDFSLLNAEPRKSLTYRHNGKTNAIFVDGHIGQFSWPFPTDLNAAPWN